MFTKKDKKIIFELRVTDVFNFQDGRTLFSGELASPVHSMGKCIGDILIDGHRFDTFEIEGSWLPGPKQIANPLLRTISTLKTISKDQIPVSSKKVINRL